MKKRKWKPRSLLERRYEESLKALGRQVVKALQGATSETIIAATVDRITKARWFQDYSYSLAKKMIQSAAVDNATDWRDAAKQAQGNRGRKIYEGLQREFSDNKRFSELIEANASVIKTLPADIAQQAISSAHKAAISGRRSDDIVKEILEKAPDIAEWKAQRIARTEVSKATESITQIRAQTSGIDWYVWSTSGDVRVREAHKLLDGVLCRYSSPPNPEAMVGIQSNLGAYNAGCTPNCRCYSGPIVRVDFIDFPIRVHVNGRIVKINTKAQFLAL